MARLTAILLIVLFALGSALAHDNPVPFLNQPLRPDSVEPFHGAFTLTVTGTGFVSGATVNWNGIPMPTTFVSSSELQAAIPATSVESHQTVTVTVVNPRPRGGASNPVYFPVQYRRAQVAFAKEDTPVAPAGGSVFTLQDLVVGDFNNDGIPDLALGWTVGNGGEIDVLLGNGDGTFRTIVTPSSFPPQNLVVGDFNGDGNLDLATADATNSGGGCGVPMLYTFLGSGDGHFTVTPSGDSSLGWPLATADLNGDGNLDLVTTSVDNACVIWYPAVNLGNGDGAFQNPITIQSTQEYAVPAIGDFNGDGKLDLAFSIYAPNQGVDLFQGNGNGTFQTPRFTATQNFAAVFSLAAADLNLTGRLDLVTNALDVLRGRGNGTFQDIPGLALGGGGPMQLADFNGDQKTDAIIYNYGSFDTLLYEGNNTFQAPQNWLSGNLYFVGNGDYFVIADFYGDGRLGFATVDQDALTASPVLSIFRQTDLSVTPNFWDFGGAKGVPQAFTLVNISGKTLPISVEVMREAKTFTQTNDCGASLASGATCTINVVFTPQHKGPVSSEIRVSYGSAIGSPQYIELYGSSQ
jgi:hypothetical protein